MKIYRQAFLFFIVLLAILACKKPPEFPNAPEITYLGIKKTIGYTPQGVGADQKPSYIKIDSVVISLYFKDGDGDLGTSDTTSGNNNYFCEIFIKKDSSFIDLISLDSKFAPLNPDGRQGPIEGTLNFAPSIEFRLIIDSTQYHSPYTLKFKVSIQDNAGHRSNEIETDTIQFRFYQ